MPHNRKSEKSAIKHSGRPTLSRCAELPVPNEAITQAIELPVPIRGRWITDSNYADLRNAAWFVRNYRIIGHDDTLAIAKLTHAVRLLFDAGEPIESVIPSLADLFMRP